MAQQRKQHTTTEHGGRVLAQLEMGEYPEIVLHDARSCPYLSTAGKALVNAARPLALRWARDKRLAAAFALPTGQWSHHAHRDLVTYLAWSMALPPRVVRAAIALEN